MAAYLIADINVHDAKGFSEYVNRVPGVVRKHGGRYIVRGADAELEEGNWRPHRLVVIEFPDKASARAFFDDPEYAPVAAIRHASAVTNAVIVEGYPAD